MCLILAYGFGNLEKPKKKNYHNNSDNDKTNAFESLKIRAPSKVKLVNVPFGLF